MPISTKPKAKRKKTAHSSPQPAIGDASSLGANSSHRRIHIAQLAEKLLKETSLTEVLLLASWCIAHYLLNPDFSYPSEWILNVVLLGTLATGFFYAIKKVICGRWGLFATHTASMFMSYVLYAYSYAFPSLQAVARHLMPDSLTPFGKVTGLLTFFTLVFCLLSVGFTWLMRRFFTAAETPLLKIGLFMVCFVFVSQMAKVGAQVWKYRHELAYKPAALQLTQDTSKIIAKPNIYYLVFDRYASNETLQTIYQYDNSAMTNFLTEQGFANRLTAYSNYPFTMMSLGSTLKMEYQTDLTSQFQYRSVEHQAGFPYRKALDSPPVAHVLKNNGYEYTMLSSWWDFTRKSVLADRRPTDSYRLQAFGKTFWLTDLQRDIVNKSVLSPLLLKGASVGSTPIIRYDLDRAPAENLYAQLATLKTLAATAKQSAKPQFVFAHILSPHDPYIFLPDGSSTTYDQNRTDNDADEKVKYINQLSYVTGQFRDTIAHIRANDPGAVIILQADEGPYPKQFQGGQSASHYHNPVDLPDAELRQKYGIFASYYLPGVSQEETLNGIDSPVNAFRFVLSHYLGYTLPNLPDCSYSVGAKYKLYQATDVTARLRGSSENAAVCLAGRD